MESLSTHQFLVLNYMIIERPKNLFQNCLKYYSCRLSLGDRA